MSLISELKRRHVFRVAMVYIVTAWLVLQVAEFLFEVLGVPEWAVRALLVVALLGLPLVLGFVWAFEVTPEGIVREGEAPSSPGEQQRKAARLNLTAITVTALALAVFAGDRLLSGQPEPAQSELSAVSTEARAPAASAPPSIAVLAFDNMSPNPENQYFAEGISEEILNVLAQIKELRVASRTSAFSFAGRPTPIPEIARALDVEHVLEGSVRRQGDRVRITAQLIRARDDAHLWSDSYDRELTDIFAVQEEIARNIVAMLPGALGLAQVDVDAPTEDMEAYELYLRGRALFYKRQDLPKAIEDLKAAVSRDPSFAEAWAVLAASYQVISGYSAGVTPEETFPLAIEAGERALALDPGNVLTRASMAMANFDELQTREGLEAVYRDAPEVPEVNFWLGLARLMAGHPDLAVPVLEAAYRLDPLVGIYHGYLGIAYLYQGRRELGREHILRAAELGWGFGLEALSWDLLSHGEYAEVRALLEGVDAPDPLVEAVERAIEGAPDPEEAVRRLMPQWLAGFERSIAPYMFRPAYLPRTRALRESPEFFAVAEENNMLGVWEAFGFPLGCEPVTDGAGRRHLACPEI